MWVCGTAVVFTAFTSIIGIKVIVGNSFQIDPMPTLLTNIVVHLLASFEAEKVGTPGCSVDVRLRVFSDSSLEYSVRVFRSGESQAHQIAKRAARHVF